ncbi:hypothetical protein KIW84_050094 [Lathyrus oleraceus]|uniref:Uncharacterized protein n=1 Tax=Pisum sativum TaxID=3888 RepID=A0A9D4WIX2_PEA|nr:hypothetical protein KIW84_050094 [Pisum sativum]
MRTSRRTTLKASSRKLSWQHGKNLTMKEDEEANLALMASTFSNSEFEVDFESESEHAEHVLSNLSKSDLSTLCHDLIERSIRRASFSSSQTSSKASNVPKGYLAVYVGEQMKRFVIPMSYLNQSSFQSLLSQAEEEFRYDHPMGGLTIPCTEDVFLHITSCFNGL